jgi:hypothetical protein
MSELEVIVDGESVQTEPLVDSDDGSARRAVTLVPLAFEASSTRHFVVFHARGEMDLSPLHPGLRPFAVSNPIFVTTE